MLDIYDLYFKWLMRRLNSDDISFNRVCLMFHNNVFQRRVGNDINRAVDGVSLRRYFLDDYSEADLDPRVTNSFLEEECTWFEMLLALAEALDYLYDGGVKERLAEIFHNLGLEGMLRLDHDAAYSGAFDSGDQDIIDEITARIDNNYIGRNGELGIFPLLGTGYPDQREVEIWDQHAAYFSERLEEGGLWTSTY